jgi:hypothetical protein
MPRIFVNVYLTLNSAKMLTNAVLNLHLGESEVPLIKT